MEDLLMHRFYLNQSSAIYDGVTLVDTRLRTNGLLVENELDKCSEKLFCAGGTNVGGFFFFKAVQNEADDGVIVMRTQIAGSRVFRSHARQRDSAKSRPVSRPARHYISRDRSTTGPTPTHNCS